MSGKLSKEFVATVLVESVSTTDQAVCDKYGVSLRSLRRYRQMLAEDDELACFVHTKKKLFDEAWAEVVPAALRNSLEFLTDAAAKARNDPHTYRNPMLIEAYAGAAKLCADIYYTGKIIDARIAESNRPPDQLSQPGDSGTETASRYVS
jgi:hypothetical protein